MKKSLLYLVMLLMGTSVFTACSDDDDDKSPVLGKWEFNQEIITDEFTDEETSVPEILVNMTTANDSILLQLMPGYEQTVPNAQFQAFMKTILRGFAGEYLSALNYIEFLDDHQVRISYIVEGEAQKIEPGLIRYYVEKNKIFLGADEKMLSALAEGIDLTKIPGIVRKGDDITMPLMYSLENGKLNLFVTKDMMMPFFDLIAGLMPEMSDTILGFKKSITSTKSFELGLVMKPSTK